jgi:hypothetical protein
MSLHRFEGKKGRKEVSGRSLNTYQAQNTAYDRAFSSKSILTQMIPNFLVQTNSKEGLTSIDLLRLNLSKPRPDQIQSLDLSNSPVKLRDSESPNNRLKISSEKLTLARNIEKMTHDIFNPTLPINEVILKLNKKTLTRSELICFREGSDLPEAVVDCYMSILKLTGRVHSSQKEFEKTIVLNTSYSRVLFKNKAQTPRPTQNIFDNNFLMVPIFDGYWTLLVVNLKTGITNFYDGLMPDREIQSILIILRRFLANANINEVQGIDESFVKYEKLELPSQNMSLKDSGVFICKVAESIAQHREIKQFDFRNCRKDMLNSLIRVYLKLI